MAKGLHPAALERGRHTLHLIRPGIRYHSYKEEAKMVGTGSLKRKPDMYTTVPSSHVPSATSRSWKE